jgi:hypothetical protein
MTDTAHAVPQHGSAAAQVRAFYEAVAAKDGPALRAIVETSFAPDAAMIWPSSLPYGGVVSGAAKLGRMFAAVAVASVPVGAVDLAIVDIVDGGDRVAARVDFDWYAPGSGTAVHSSALELWTFDGGLVREVRAYYWDTAELLDPRGETS